MDYMIINPSVAVFIIALIAIALIFMTLYLRQNTASKRAIADLLRAQHEVQINIKALGEHLGNNQHATDQNLNQQLAILTQQIHQNLQQQNKNQTEQLGNLHQRLNLIDHAQQNIQHLAGQMMELQNILSDKQTRGAFGQVRMEAIITDALPPYAYKFQAVLSNGKRPDCVINMPKERCSLVIDAKFPLEAWETIKNELDIKIKLEANKQFKRDLLHHINNIADRYLIAGETYDTAFLFVPSESIFADIHEQHQDIVQQAYRKQVVIVSPSLLLLSIQVIQSMFKDARMSEQARLIQREVGLMAADVKRLEDRVSNLQKHLQSTNKDIDEILISSKKIGQRSHKVMETDLTEPTGKPPINLEYLN